MIRHDTRAEVHAVIQHETDLMLKPDLAQDLDDDLAEEMDYALEEVSRYESQART